MSEDFGWACGRVLRWHEPSAALDDGPPYNLDIFDSELGIWLTLAHVDLEEDAMAQGIPVLRGPYVVDYTDIPHDGDTKTLWTPAVGDVLLRLFSNEGTATELDSGTVNIGTTALPGLFGAAANLVHFDLVNSIDVWVFNTTDPVQIQLTGTGGTDPTRGHVELYALVARAVAP